MKKYDEIQDRRSCFNAAQPDTKMFVLLDWDRASPGTIRFWALERVKLGLNKPDDPEIKEANRLAAEIEDGMEEARKMREKRKAILEGLDGAPRGGLRTDSVKPR